MIKDASSKSGLHPARASAAGNVQVAQLVGNSRGDAQIFGCVRWHYLHQ